MTWEEEEAKREWQAEQKAIAKEAYTTAVDAVKVKYEPRILALLGKFKGQLERAGFRVEGPDDWSDDTYSWSMAAYPFGCEDPEMSADIHIEIAESRASEGTLDGINFSMSVSRYGGSILGQFTPFNYTDRCWVPLDNPGAIEERFKLFSKVRDVVECVRG